MNNDCGCKKNVLDNPYIYITFFLFVIVIFTITIYENSPIYSYKGVVSDKYTLCNRGCVFKVVLYSDSLKRNVSVPINEYFYNKIKLGDSICVASKSIYVK